MHFLEGSDHLKQTAGRAAHLVAAAVRKIVQKLVSRVESKLSHALSVSRLDGVTRRRLQVSGKPADQALKRGAHRLGDESRGLGPNVRHAVEYILLVDRDPAAGNMRDENG
jgi:hypothetical protein